MDIPVSFSSRPKLYSLPKAREIMSTKALIHLLTFCTHTPTHPPEDCRLAVYIWTSFLCFEHHKVKHNAESKKEFLKRNLSTFCLKMCQMSAQFALYSLLMTCSSQKFTLFCHMLEVPLVSSWGAEFNCEVLYESGLLVPWDKLPEKTSYLSSFSLRGSSRQL